MLSPSVLVLNNYHQDSAYSNIAGLQSKMHITSPTQQAVRKFSERSQMIHVTHMNSLEH